MSSVVSRRLHCALLSSALLLNLLQLLSAIRPEVSIPCIDSNTRRLPVLTSIAPRTHPKYHHRPSSPPTDVCSPLVIRLPLPSPSLQHHLRQHLPFIRLRIHGSYLLQESPQTHRPLLIARQRPWRRVLVLLWRLEGRWRGLMWHRTCLRLEMSIRSVGCGRCRWSFD